MTPAELINRVGENSQSNNLQQSCMKDQCQQQPEPWPGAVAPFRLGQSWTFRQVVVCRHKKKMPLIYHKEGVLFDFHTQVCTCRARNQKKISFLWLNEADALHKWVKRPHLWSRASL